MKKHLTTAALIAACCPFAANAGIFIAGSFQVDAGGGSDWDPPTAPEMVETAAGSGIFTYTTPALTAGTNYEFKILDSGGNANAAWGDTELPGTSGANGWFLVDADGVTSITVDTNIANAVSVSDDVSTVFATGDWMDESGGAGDWNAGDAMFQMTDTGGGVYELNVTVGTAGTYEYKATRGDFAGQWGSDGRNVNAGTVFFTITDPATETVTFTVDQYAATVSAVVVPEPASAALLGLGALAMLRRRR